MADPDTNKVENRIIILCSRLNLTPQDLSEIQSLIASDLDWEMIIKKANFEGVSPLLYSHLKKYKTRIPENAMKSLKERYIVTTARNIITYRRLTTLLQAIMSQG